MVKAVYAVYVNVYIYCTIYSGRPEYNSLFVGLGGGVLGAMSEKFVSKAVYKNGDGLDV
jgi:hypothetical protein